MIPYCIISYYITLAYSVILLLFRLSRDGTSPVVCVIEGLEAGDTYMATVQETCVDVETNSDVVRTGMFRWASPGDSLSRTCTRWCRVTRQELPPAEKGPSEHCESESS